MASGVALRESVKEMKRLKNEPLLMLAIIAIILFVGFFVVYPVIRVITFPSGQDYMQLFQKARWLVSRVPILRRSGSCNFSVIKHGK